MAMRGELSFVAPNNRTLSNLDNPAALRMAHSPIRSARSRSGRDPNALSHPLYLALESAASDDHACDASVNIF